MKLKLKNPNATPNDAPAASPAPPAGEAAAPAPITAKPGGFKLKLKPAAPAPAADGDASADAPKQKRKYTKKPKIDADGNAVPPGKPGPKKRAREDGEDGEPPAAKRKPKPTLKSLESIDDSDDDDLAPPEPVRTIPRIPANRQTSLKLSIKPKPSASGANPVSRGAAILKVKGAGRPPFRPPGVGYDSEADEAEIDPAIEAQFVLRMLPGPDCDLLRKSIEEKTIGRSVMNGGPGVHFRFFDREGRKAMVSIQGRHYAASMVELPNIIESMKSWNKKDWVKTADVCQMLLVLGRVQNEDEAKKYPRPSYVEENSHRFPHGLTPPMRWVRKRRFRPRKSYLDVERAEAEMNALLAADENAENTKYELVDEGAESSEDESGSEDDEDEEMANAPQLAETPIEEVDAAALEEMLQAGFMEDDDVEIQADGEDIEALFGSSDAVEGQRPVTAHDAAVHALAQNGNIVIEPETAPATPAAATSAEDDDDDDDDDDSDDDEVDEAAAAEQQRRELLEAEVAELEKAIQQSIESRDKQNNGLFKQRMNKTIERQQQDLHIKKKQLNELNGNDDADD
jgi:transcription initiation factor TFIID subunit 7